MPLRHKRGRAIGVSPDVGESDGLKDGHDSQAGDGNVLLRAPRTSPLTLGENLDNRGLVR